MLVKPIKYCIGGSSGDDEDEDEGNDDNYKEEDDGELRNKYPMLIFKFILKSRECCDIL